MMQKIILFLATFLLGLPLTGSQVGIRPITVRPENVLSVVTGDWNNDANFDRALLIANQDGEADLLIYLSEKDQSMKLAINEQDFVWKGASWGTLPYLELGKNNALVVVSQNESIGRYRWTQKVTIVRQGADFVIEDYSYSSRDTLDLQNALECKTDFFNGKTVKNGVSIQTKPRLIKASDWSAGYMPAECKQQI